MENIICVSELVIKPRPGWLLWNCNPCSCCFAWRPRGQLVLEASTVSGQKQKEVENVYHPWVCSPFVVVLTVSRVTGDGSKWCSRPWQLVPVPAKKIKPQLLWRRLIIEFPGVNPPQDSVSVVLVTAAIICSRSSSLWLQLPAKFCEALFCLADKARTPRRDVFWSTLGVLLVHFCKMLCQVDEYGHWCHDNSLHQSASVLKAPSSLSWWRSQTWLQMTDLTMLFSKCNVSQMTADRWHTEIVGPSTAGEFGF